MLQGFSFLIVKRKVLGFNSCCGWRGHHRGWLHVLVETFSLVLPQHPKSQCKTQRQELTPFQALPHGPHHLALLLAAQLFSKVSVVLLHGPC